MANKPIRLYLSIFIIMYLTLILMACTKTEEIEDEHLMSIVIHEVNQKILVDDTVQLHITTNPLDTDDIIVWESSDVQIATVSQTGLVTALKKGPVIIYAKNEHSTVFDFINLNIEEKNTEIPIEPDPEYYSNSVVDFRNSADPSVIRHEGVFYAFVTGVNSKIMTSTNLVDWVNSDVTPISGRPGWGTTNAGVWAPDIVQINGEFIMYYAHSVWDDPDPGIGYATAPHPLGPWTDHGKMFLSSEIGVNNSIDPAVFIAQDGKVYMIWGSFRGIYGAELTADGRSFVGGVSSANQNKVLLAGYETSLPWNQSTYEAPYVIYKDGYYYLFLSTGLCCEGLNSTYAVRVARSKNPLGPYLDSQGRDMLAGDRGHHVINGTSRMIGPGHNSVITDDAGDDWLVYHVYDYQDLGDVPPYRTMAIDKLIWDEAGWPAVRFALPSTKAVVPFISSQNEFKV